MGQKIDDQTMNREAEHKKSATTPNDLEFSRSKLIDVHTHKQLAW
jgi:hypothetical protein